MPETLPQSRSWMPTLRTVTRSCRPPLTRSIERVFGPSSLTPLYCTAELKRQPRNELESQEGLPAPSDFRIGLALSVVSRVSRSPVLLSAVSRMSANEVRAPP